MHNKKPIRPSTVAVLLAVILLMLILSNREQNKAGIGAFPFAEKPLFLTVQHPVSAKPNHLFV